MKPKLKKKMGRPKNEVPTRQTYIRWPEFVADWMEENREKIVKMAKKARNINKKK